MPDSPHDFFWQATDEMQAVLRAVLPRLDASTLAELWWAMAARDGRPVDFSADAGDLAPRADDVVVFVLEGGLPEHRKANFALAAMLVWVELQQEIYRAGQLSAVDPAAC